MPGHCAMIALSRLEAAARHRPASYFVDVVLSGHLHNGVLHLSWRAYSDLQRRWAGGRVGYMAVVQAISAAPDTAPWTSLKEQLARHQNSVLRARQAVLGCQPCRVAKLEAYLMACMPPAMAMQLEGREACP